MRTVEKMRDVIDKGPYRPSVESLKTHPVPRWFQDAKFGIFLHWGVYSVPAFGNEWYARNMYIKGTPEYEHHRKTYGPQESFGYEQLIPYFRAEHFDPDALMRQIKEAGARFVVPVGEHHDGFCMYKSALTRWNAKEMGPKRDLIREMERAVKEQGLVFGISSHHLEHWFFFDHAREAIDVTKDSLYWPAVRVDDFDQNKRAAPAPDKDFLTDWVLRCVEMIDRFHPQELYFDWWTMEEAVKPYLLKVLCYYYNSAALWKKEVLAITKRDSLPKGVSVRGVERGAFPDVQEDPWQMDTAAAYNSWCYTENNRYKSAGTIIRDLCDAVAKNGCLLLNIGPKADGTISWEETRLLQEIGHWLRDNGEAIYGSRPWKAAKEGSVNAGAGDFADQQDPLYTGADFRFTRKGSTLYVISMGFSQDGSYLVRSLAGEKGIASVTLLPGEKVDFSMTEAGLRILAPSRDPSLPCVFRIERKGEEG